MRLLACADVHGRWPVYEWLLETARAVEAEAIVLAGDLLGFLDGFETPEEAQRHESARLVALLEGAGVPVFYIMGNDDFVELDSRSRRVCSIHGRRVEHGGFNFVGYQYSLPFMGGTFEKPEDGIRSDLVPMADLLDPATVFVTHSPAFGILDPGIGGVRIGSRAMTELLEARPFHAHIHGHSHAGFGRFGRHFNVAAAARARAMMLDLESMQHQVLEPGGGGEQTAGPG
jgi:Icc-related predicted phosphoesterase